MLLKDFVQSSRSRLSHNYTAEEAAAMTSILCGSFFGLKQYSHLVTPTLELPADSLGQALEALDRLGKGEPLQYVLGYAEFHGRRFTVNPNVLIPRPETEELCSMAVSAFSSRTKSDLAQIQILDLCTGSGCIAWTLALELPGSRVTAVDISDGALETASGQNFSPGSSSMNFIKADVLDTEALTKAVGTGFDMIVSNPPYVMESEKSMMRTNVLDYEPALALFVSDGDPLIFYKKIAAAGQIILNTDGKIFVEINEALGDAAMRIFADNGYSDVVLHKDVFEKNRFISCKKISG